MARVFEPGANCGADREKSHPSEAGSHYYLGGRLGSVVYPLRSGPSFSSFPLRSCSHHGKSVEVREEGTSRTPRVFSDKARGPAWQWLHRFPFPALLLLVVVLIQNPI